MRQMLAAAGSQAWLEVDGGIKPDNVGEVVAAGATAIYKGAGTIAENLAEFRRAWGD